MLSDKIIRQLFSFPAAANLSARQCTVCSSPGGIMGRLGQQKNGIDMQGAWCCSPKCFEVAAERTLMSMLAKQDAAPEKRYRLPLGLLLLSHGVINQHQLQLALDAQQKAGEGRIGEWLQRLGYVSEQEVLAALSIQWGCPVMKSSGIHPLGNHGIPFAILSRHGIVPVFYSSAAKKLYIAFSAGINHCLLYAIEQMLDCKAEPCVVAESTLAREIEVARANSDSEVLFETIDSVSEMARICCNYATQLHATEMRVSRCGDYIWTRLLSKGRPVDLLFGLTTGIAAEHSTPGPTAPTL